MKFSQSWSLLSLLSPSPLLGVLRPADGGHVEQVRPEPVHQRTECHARPPVRGHVGDGEAGVVPQLQPAPELQGSGPRHLARPRHWHGGGDVCTDRVQTGDCWDVVREWRADQLSSEQWALSTQSGLQYQHRIPAERFVKTMRDNYFSKQQTSRYYTLYVIPYKLFVIYTILHTCSYFANGNIRSCWLQRNIYILCKSIRIIYYGAPSRSYMS